MFCIVTVVFYLHLAENHILKPILYGNSTVGYGTRYHMFQKLSSFVFCCLEVKCPVPGSQEGNDPDVSVMFLFCTFKIIFVK
jgi:hypothetical protein